MTTKSTTYNIGDKVKVKEGKEHSAMAMGKVGKIIQISTPALVIKFEGMSKIHKWYVDDELEDA